MRKLFFPILLLSAYGISAFESKFLMEYTMERSSINTNEKVENLSVINDNLIFSRGGKIYTTLFNMDNDLRMGEERSDLNALHISGQFSEYNGVLYYSSNGLLCSSVMKNGLWVSEGELKIDGYGSQREKGKGSSLFYGRWSYETKGKTKEPMFNPFIANKGKRLYFTSTMEGGKGGKDIWYIERNADGKTWSAPINEESVNTDKDEDYPVLMSDNTLYFSSNRDSKLKGFNIYKKNLSDKKPAVQLDNMYNSNGNDINFVVVGGIPYFLSDKNGIQNIYYAKLKEVDND